MSPPADPTIFYCDPIWICKTDGPGACTPPRSIYCTHHKQRSASSSVAAQTTSQHTRHQTVVRQAHRCPAAAAQEVPVPRATTALSHVWERDDRYKKSLIYIRWNCSAGPRCIIQYIPVQCAQVNKGHLIQVRRPAHKHEAPTIKHSDDPPRQRSTPKTPCLAHPHPTALP